MTAKTRFVVLCMTGLIVVSLSASVMSFAFLGWRWNPGAIDMEIQLGPAAGLLDESADWDQCVMAGFQEWNAFLGPAGVFFNPILGSTREPAAGDGFNNVFFSDTFFGTPWGPTSLALANTFYFERDGVDEAVESDVLFNTGASFNCYRGPTRGIGSTPELSAFDAKRIFVHELGHTLGLDHPDENGQAVDAIMNSTDFPGNPIDTLTNDDINGVLTLYGLAVTGLPFPPRDEVLLFFLDLQILYRDALLRIQNNLGFVDTEGSAVWFPEWLRYRLSGCSGDEAALRVLLQIEDRGIQPVCAAIAEGTIPAFPPRNESLDFLLALDSYYQSVLGRPVLFDFIDREGIAVWLVEYLRYRVNGCDHPTATQRVEEIILTGVTSPVCA